MSKIAQETAVWIYRGPTLFAKILCNYR